MASKSSDTVRDWGFRGNEAQEHAKNAVTRKSKGPFRFFLKKGDSAQIVILDKSFEDVPHLYEHEIPGPGNDWKKTRNELSLKNRRGMQDPLERYPIVNGDTSTPYYAAFVSILDLTPYTNKDNEVIPFTRKLLVIKATQLDQFKKIFSTYEAKHGTLRGAHFELSRADGGLSARIGTPGPIDLDFKFMDEKELKKRFSHPVKKNQQGQVYLKKDEMLQPFDIYEELEMPEAEEIYKQYGLNPDGTYDPSNRHNDAWNQSPDEEDDSEPDVVEFAD